MFVSIGEIAAEYHVVMADQLDYFFIIETDYTQTNILTGDTKILGVSRPRDTFYYVMVDSTLLQKPKWCYFSALAGNDRSRSDIDENEIFATHAVVPAVWTKTDMSDLGETLVVFDMENSSTSE